MKGKGQCPKKIKYLKIPLRIVQAHNGKNDVLGEREVSDNLWHAGKIQFKSTLFFNEYRDRKIQSTR